MAITLEVSPFVGYRFGGSLDIDDADYEYDELEVEPGEAYGLSVGVEIDDVYMLELMWSRQESALVAENGDSGISEQLCDMTVDQYHFNALYQWATPQEWWRPFLIFGLGASYFDPKSSSIGSEVRFSFGVGGGIKLYMGKHLGIRLQGRYTPSYFSSHSASFCNAGSCYVTTSGNLVHQGEFSAGVIVRF